MALPNTTTLSAAVGRNDITVLLASLTNVFAGNLIRIDDEFIKVVGPVPAAATTPVPVLRGVEGTAVVAHAATAQVLLGANPSTTSAGDWGQPTAGGASPVIGARAKPKRSINYAAAGAITLPNPGEDMTAIIDGTTILAMTLANPSVLNDGDRITIVGNGKAAHTVTYAAGAGNVGATADVFTFNAAQAQAFELVAAGGFWVLPGVNTAVAGAGATIDGVGLG